MKSLLILIVGIPLIEIYLFIKIGSVIGAFNTIALIIITALIIEKRIGKFQSKI